MAITERDEEIIEYAFVRAFLSEGDEAADKVLEAWNQLWELMKRENNFSNQLGSSVLDWQIGNWANDTTMLLYNKRRYQDVIAVNEQILKIQWSKDGNDDLFHENAKREIADTYADLGDFEKAYRLYEEYLDKDPIWGWGWIGYYRLFKDQRDLKYVDIMKDLYSKIKSGERFRDMEDLCRELSEEFAELEEDDISEFLNEKYEQETDAKSRKFRLSFADSMEKLDRKLSAINLYKPDSKEGTVTGKTYEDGE